ncbi:MAG TPA: IS110 family transposase [Terracidiphilus sp.]|nr:IS110 family transposase [Terracidiphilus sp.]
MTNTIAGIDIHKRVLMVVVIPPGSNQAERRKFGATTAELTHLLTWLQQRQVEEVVMESTAQYWKPVWFALEGHFHLRLAQAWSNRAPHGKKTDFKDAERLVRRQRAGELTLSFVPEAAQRQLRSLTRRRTQLSRDRVRIQNQVESLLEETRIKISSVLTDLFGASGLRMLAALARGETNPAQLAALADARVQCPPQELAEALTGTVNEIHRRFLKQHLDHLELIDKQMEELLLLTAEIMREHADSVARLADVPGIRVLSAQQIIAETGVTASAFASAAQFSSWIGVCPGREESAQHNRSSRTAKGNPYLRRVLCQAAQAAVRTNHSFFQQKFKRLLPRLGYPKAIWAIAHHLAIVIWKILHEGASYLEYGGATSAQAAKRRLQRIKKELKALGYSDELKPLAIAAPSA